MKNITSTKLFLASIAVAIMLSIAGGATAAFAQGDTDATDAAVTSTTAKPSIKAAEQESRATARAAAETKTLQKLKDRATKEIEKRIETLQKLAARMQTFKSLTSDDVAVIEGPIQSQIQELTTLKTTVGAATSTAVLKADIELINKSYRTYALVVPQATIFASIDSVATLVSQMIQVQTKLATRLGQIASTTADISAAQVALDDFNAKIADAQKQITNAKSLLTGLKPDNGDKTITRSNTKMLQDARTAVQAARKDLETSRKNIATIQRTINKITPSTRDEEKRGNATSTRNQ